MTVQHTSDKNIYRHTYSHLLHATYHVLLGFVAKNISNSGHVYLTRHQLQTFLNEEKKFLFLFFFAHFIIIFEHFQASNITIFTPENCLLECLKNRISRVKVASKKQKRKENDNETKWEKENVLTFKLFAIYERHDFW